MKDHVANVEGLSQRQVHPVESQLRSKRLRCYGHVLRQADDRLTQCMSFEGLVKSKGQAMLASPIKIWTDVVMIIYCKDLASFQVCPERKAQSLKEPTINKESGKVH